jgi:hypothetical protein
MGNSTTTTTTLGDKNVFDLTVSHAFGPVQVTARIVDIDTSLTARIETGIPGALTLGVAYGHSIGSSNYFGSQSIGYSYKRVVMPRRLALAGSVGTGLYEEDFVSNQQLRIVGHVVDVSVNAGPEIQLSRRVALAGTIGVSVAAEHSSSIAVTTFVVANANVLVAFRRCDLYAAFELDSLTDHVHPWAALGIVIRFGTLAG